MTAKQRETDPPEITVDLLIPSVESLKVSSKEGYLIDDLNQRACELVRIPPMFRYLTALYDLKNSTFLAPHHTIGGDEKSHNLQLRIRFHPANLDSIMGSITMEFYYYQMRDFLFNYKLKDQNVETLNRLLGLVITDYVRKLIMQNEQPNEENILEDLVASSLPTNLKFSWWKKLIVKKDFTKKVQLCYKHSNQDKVFIECAYIEEIWELLPSSRQEQFVGQVFIKGSHYPCVILVGHSLLANDESADGPSLSIVHNDETRNVFNVRHLCYLNVDNEEVEVHVRNEQPINLLMEKRYLTSFMVLLDGYFRMTERFIACLCADSQHPAIVELKKRKIHGPLAAASSHKKLREFKNRVGSFLVRQSPTAYRTLLVDLIKPNGSIETLTVLEDGDGNFRLEDDPEECAFQKLPDLIKTRLASGQDFYQVPPSDYDKTGLGWCRQSKETSKEDSDLQEAKILQWKHVKLENADIKVSGYQRVRKGAYKNRQVIVRSLFDMKYCSEFMKKCNDFLLCKSREIVPVLGFIMVTPISLVMEHMPMGCLHEFLNQRGDELSIGDLGDAALCLAKALWYLEEIGVVHGKVRCRSAFVAECVRSSFKVKLGDPGYLSYSDADIHWIAPEYLSVMDSVAYSQKADVYALGTTIWEIFNLAKDPADFLPLCNTRQFYATGNRLPLTEVPQEFFRIISDCWHWDPDERRSPHSIVRDIHQLLYQIYQPKRHNTYAAIDTNSLSLNPAETEPAPELPPLRTVKKNNLERRESATSQTSIVSRRGWRLNPMKSLFWSSKPKEYDTLSNISNFSAAPSVQTVTTDIQDNGELLHIEEDEPDENCNEPDNDQNWVIERKDLRLGNPLGQGFFGMVFEATLVRYSGILEEQVAVKRMKASVAAESNHKDLEREIEIMKKLRHPNIVEIKGIVEEPEIFLVMEYFALGSLLAYLDCYRSTITHSQLLKYSYDIANAMAYLERKRIIHRDLAARNILVQSETCVKISDFGLAHVIDRDYYSIQNLYRNLPIKWYAPESIMYGKFSVKSDVWSFGVALWEMFSFGEDPLINGCEDLARLGERLKEGLRLPIPDNCPEDVYQIMRDCWRIDDQLRPTFSTLKKKTEEMIQSTG